MPAKRAKAIRKDPVTEAKPLPPAPTGLLKYQQDWISDPAPVRIYEKSRQIGISWTTACECVLVAMDSDNGTDCYYVTYNRPEAQLFIRTAADWARKFQQLAVTVQEEVLHDEGRDITCFYIEFASGYRITALSSRPSNMRGKSGAYVIIDEAAFHQSIGELLKAALAMLIWGGRVAVISTHDGIDNPFGDLVAEVRAKKRPGSIHRTTLDDALADGLYSRICLARKPGAPPLEDTPEGQAAWRQALIDQYADGADEELFCVPRNSGGAYIPRAAIEARMVDDATVVRLQMDDDFKLKDPVYREKTILDWCEEHIAPLCAALDRKQAHYYGEDFGRVSDLTVIAPMALTQRLVRRIPFLVELANVPYEQQRQTLFFLLDRLPRLAGGALDATGNGGFVAEVAAQRYGENLAQNIMLSDKWYAAELPPLRSAFEDGMISLPRDADVLSDLRQLQTIKGIPKLPDVRKKSADGKRKRHGDAAIAIALAFYASRTEVEEFGYYRVASGIAAEEDFTAGLDWRGDGYRRPRSKRDTRRVKATAGIRSHRGGVL
jgi:phage FluMu gp28-like protein